MYSSENRIPLIGAVARRLALVAGFVLSFLAAATLLHTPTARAAGTVTDCGTYGPGAGTLQAALAGGGAVTFACNGAIIVPEIVIIQDTVLDGTTHNVTLSGNNANRVLRVDGSANLTVRNLTIANGNPQGSGAGAINDGGGIYFISSGDLTIENSVFENNKSLRLAGDILAKASGGAVSYANTNGALTIRDSTFRNNQTAASGGALSVAGYIGNRPRVTITGSAFSGNQAGNGNPNAGGAIVVVDSAEITLTNSTLSGNSAYRGGGLALAQGKRSQNMTARLTHVTLAGNTATQAANFYSSKTSSSSQTIDLANTIIGGGCSVESGVTLNSLGYNLSSDNSCAFLTAATDQQNVNPQLAALANNGGRTQTMALQPGSPAINKIPLVNGSCNDSGVAADQRGYARPEPSGSLCDIGAYEAGAQPPADAGLTIVKETVGGGGAFTFTSTSLTPSPFSLAAGQRGTFNGAYNVSAAGWGFNCALKPDGNVSCWDSGAASFVVPAGPFIEIDAHDAGACGLRPDGSVDCWGENNYGVGNPQAGPYTTISLGSAHGCGLTPAGAVECWGHNNKGQANPKPGPYVDVSALKEATCGLTPAGAMECWGNQNFASPGPYTQISGGRQQVCALKTDGTVACWGYGVPASPAALPVGPFVEISTLDDTACGLRPNGALECWGAHIIYVVPPTGTYSRLGTADYRGICAITPSGAADCMGYFNVAVYDKPGPFAQSDLSQKTFSNLVPGTYDVTEQIPAGWNLTGLTCDGGNPQVNGATVSLTLAQGQHVTCTYEDTYAPAGTIIISKQTAPADNAGTQQFGFTDNISSPNAFTLVHGGEQVFSNVPSGTYTVTEASASVGYYLADLTCVESGGRSQANSSGNLATGEATIHLEPGETVRCTYTNAQADVIIVEKVTDPADPGGNFDFGFTVSDGINPDGSFALKDGEQEVFPVAQGTYTITEQASTFHELTAIECAVIDANGNETPVNGDLNTRGAALTLAAGEIGFCRFTNTELASLTVVKEAFPPDGTEFQFEVHNGSNTLIDAFGLQDTDTITNPEHLVGGGGLLPDFYWIKELVNNVPDWANVNIACELADGTPKNFGNVALGEIGLRLEPGEDVTCTFTNVMEGKINITKQATPDDGTVFAFSGELGAFTLTHGLTAEYVVPFGAYDVDEAVPPGWSLDDIQCVQVSGSTSTFDYNIVPNGVRIDLGPGEEVTCTFANSKIPTGTINIVKDATPADNTPFHFANTIDNATFTLSDPLTTTQTFTNLLPGGYRVVELQNAAQWNLTGINCIESVTQNSAVSVPLRTAEIQVNPGETVTCTFSNREVLTGTINILKIAQPADGRPFSFTSDIPGNTSFSLADDGVSDAYVKTIAGAPAGSYVVTETVTAGWGLADVLCYDDTGDSVGDPANRRAQIELQGNEEVTCVFANALLPVLTVAKAGTGSGTVTSSPAGINCGADCSESYNAGTVVTLTATADTGSTFTGWSGAGCSGTGACVVTMDAAKSVTATFTLVPPGEFALGVAKAGNGSGTVTSSPAGIDCGSQCGAGFTAGTVVTLTATPGAFSTFAGWSGACTGNGSCVVTMDAAKNVTATFDLVPIFLPIIFKQP